MSDSESQNPEHIKQIEEVTQELKRRADRLRGNAIGYIICGVALLVGGFLVIYKSEYIAGEEIKTAFRDGDSVLKTLHFFKMIEQQTKPLKFHDVTFNRNKSIAIAVGERGAIRTSADRGETWEVRTSNTTDHVKAVALSDDGRTVVAVGENGAIQRSIDGGEQWESRESNTEEHLEAIALSNNGRTAIAVGRKGTILVSTDSGRTWNNSEFDTDKPLSDVAFHKDGYTAIVVGEAGTILLSKDQGKNWKPQKKLTTNDLNAVAFNDNGKEAVVVGMNDTILFYKHGKNGKFEKKRIGEPGAGLHLNAVAFSGDCKNAIAVGDKGAIRFSPDRGQNWEDRGEGSMEKRLYDVVLNRDGRRGIAVGEAGTILVSEDQEKNWKSLDGITLNNLNAAVLSDKDKAVIIVGEHSTVLRSTLQSSPMVVTKIQIQSEVELKRESGNSNIEMIEKEENFLASLEIGYANALRFGIITVAFFLCRFLIAQARYNLRLAVFYDARWDAIQLTGARMLPTSKSVDDLVEMIVGMSPDDIHFENHQGGFSSLREWLATFHKSHSA